MDTHHFGLRQITNHPNWLEEALAMELESSPVAAASSEAAAAASLEPLSASVEPLSSQRPFCAEIIPVIEHAVPSVRPAVLRADDPRSTKQDRMHNWSTHIPHGVESINDTVVVGTFVPESTLALHIKSSEVRDCASGSVHPFVAGLEQRFARDWTYREAPPTSIVHQSGLGQHTAQSRDQTNVIVCHQPTDAPIGKTPTKVLQCGICMSNTLFDRRYELERHMATHVDGKHPCLQPGCPHTGARAFKRTEHLRNHRRRIHGV
ncbi:hypothetical protein LTR27_012476 [Elasticomyces elasticus]|nr:hypothetical protein LTR27_012476 [Elasticomyces elasticus]